MLNFGLVTQLHVVAMILNCGLCNIQFIGFFCNALVAGVSVRNCCVVLTIFLGLN